jgi:hypothetical protein
MLTLCKHTDSFGSYDVNVQSDKCDKDAAGKALETSQSLHIDRCAFEIGGIAGYLKEFDCRCSTEPDEEITSNKKDGGS